LTASSPRTIVNCEMDHAANDSRRNLYSFFVRHYSVSELKSLAWEAPHSEELMSTINWHDSLSNVAREFVDACERRGVFDAGFFEVLRGQRPCLTAKITSIQGHGSSSVNPPSGGRAKNLILVRAFLVSTVLYIIGENTMIGTPSREVSLPETVAEIVTPPSLQEKIPPATVQPPLGPFVQPVGKSELLSSGGDPRDEPPPGKRTRSKGDTILRNREMQEIRIVSRLTGDDWTVVVPAHQSCAQIATKVFVENILEIKPGTPQWHIASLTSTNLGLRSITSGNHGPVYIRESLKNVLETIERDPRDPNRTTLGKSIGTVTGTFEIARVPNRKASTISIGEWSGGPSDFKLWSLADSGLHSLTLVAPAAVLPEHEVELDFESDDVYLSVRSGTGLTPFSGQRDEHALVELEWVAISGRAVVTTFEDGDQTLVSLNLVDVALVNVDTGEISEIQPSILDGVPLLDCENLNFWQPNGQSSQDPRRDASRGGLLDTSEAYFLGACTDPR